MQGWTIPALARRLRLQVPPPPEPVDRHDLARSGAQGRAFFGYRLSAHAPLVGQAAHAISLPQGARAVAVLRDGEALAPEVAGTLAAGDVLYLLAQQADSAVLGDLAATAAAPPYLEKRQFYGDFVLRGDAQMEAVASEYDLPLPQPLARLTLEEFLAMKLRGQPVVGDRVRLGKLEFVVRAVSEGRVTQVGLRIPTHLDAEP